MSSQQFLASGFITTTYDLTPPKPSEQETADYFQIDWFFGPQLTAVGTTKTLLWDIRENVGTTKTMLWDIRQIVGQTATWLWDIGAPPVYRYFTLRWRLGNVRANSSNNLTVRGAADLTVPGATNLTVPGTATEARMADRTNTLIVPSRTGEI